MYVLNYFIYVKLLYFKLICLLFFADVIYFKKVKYNYINYLLIFIFYIIVSVLLILLHNSVLHSFDLNNCNRF